MINLTRYSDQLIERDGIFYATKDDEVSYPEKGNDDFFQIEDNSFWFIHRNNCIISAVKKFSPKSVFFDIGGGNGFISKGLAQQGIETVLLEPGIGGRLNAKKRNLHNIVCSTLENAAFKKESIAAVGLFDVIEHIEQDESFLKSIHSYLEMDGFVYITVPAFKFLWSNEDADAGHYRRYTVPALENKLRTLGFTIKQSSYIFSILPFAVFLFRTIPSRMGFNKASGDLKKHKTEHLRKKGLVDWAMEKIWKWELKSIRKGKKIPFGGSCFLVAQKQ